MLLNATTGARLMASGTLLGAIPSPSRCFELTVMSLPRNQCGRQSGVRDSHGYSRSETVETSGRRGPD